MMLLNTVSTMTSECFLVRSDTRETSSTSSALVMLPPVVMDMFLRRDRRLRDQGRWSAPPWFSPPASSPGASLCLLLSLPIPKVIAQRGGAVAAALLIRLPVGAVV